jgi:hypothetical protein
MSKHAISIILFVLSISGASLYKSRASPYKSGDSPYKSGASLYKSGDSPYKSFANPSICTSVKSVGNSTVKLIIKFPTWSSLVNPILLMTFL